MCCGPFQCTHIGITSAFLVSIAKVVSSYFWFCYACLLKYWKYFLCGISVSISLARSLPIIENMIRLMHSGILNMLCPNTFIRTSEIRLKASLNLILHSCKSMVSSVAWHGMTWHGMTIATKKYAWFELRTNECRVQSAHSQIAVKQTKIDTTWNWPLQKNKPKYICMTFSQWISSWKCVWNECLMEIFHGIAFQLI